MTPLALDSELIRNHGRCASDTEGRFEVALAPGAAGAVNLVVEAAGWPVAGFRVQAPGELELVLPPRGGRLEIRATDGYPILGELWRLLLVSESGATLPLGGLESRSVGPGRIVVPSLVPGRFRLHRVRTTEEGTRQMQLGFAAEVSEVLARFAVAAGETTEVVVSR